VITAKELVLVCLFQPLCHRSSENPKGAEKVYRRSQLVTRRDFLRLSAVASGIGLLAACTPAAVPATTSTEAESAEAPAAAKPSLIFTGWNAQEWYDPVVQEFMNENPDIDASYRMLSDYKEQITLFAAGEQTDVLVTRDDDRAGFVEAGFIRTIQDEEGVQELVDDMYPGNLAAMGAEGDLHGLPYYTDFHTLMYNYNLLTQAGYDAPPATLAELADMCVDIKAQGISEYPLGLWINQEQNFKEIMYSLVYGSKGEWVDENWDPICDEPGSVVEQIVEWTRAAINDLEIMDSANLEMADADVDLIFQNGDSVFQSANRYDLRRFNDPEQTSIAVAGERVVRPMLMPGFEGAGLGAVTWTRQYTINTNAVDQEAAFRLQYFAGGTNAEGNYWTAKQWHSRFGLGFAYQSLATDPEIVDAENTWGDPELFAQQKETAVPRLGLSAAWYSEWDNFMQAEWHKAMLGQIPASEATKAMADKWTELRTSYGA
jgi:ABC-type glycerol-3-phosphate transport system substrate-binding protein